MTEQFLEPLEIRKTSLHFHHLSKLVERRRICRDSKVMKRNFTEGKKICNEFGQLLWFSGGQSIQGYSLGRAREELVLTLNHELHCSIVYTVV